MHQGVFPLDLPLSSGYETEFPEHGAKRWHVGKLRIIQPCVYIAMQLALQAQNIRVSTIRSQSLPHEARCSSAIRVRCGKNEVWPFLPVAHSQREHSEKVSPALFEILCELAPLGRREVTRQ